MNENDFDEGLRHIMVCTLGEDCANATKQRHGTENAVFDALKAARKAEGLGRKLTVVRTSCQGWCQYAPVAMVMPQGKVVQGITPDQATAFAKAVAEGSDDQFAAQQVWDLSQSRDTNLRKK
jgi:(2Fe-2S) ferredoxin